MNKWQLVKIGIELAEEYEKQAREAFFRDGDEFYVLQFAGAIREKVNLLRESINADELERQSKKSDSGYPPEYVQSASLSERHAWFEGQFEIFRNCGFCWTLPAVPTLNAEGRREISPLPAVNEATESDVFPTRKPMPDNVSDKPEFSGVINKWELIKIGKELAREFESEAAQYDYKDDRNWYALEDAAKISSKVNELFESINPGELDRKLKNSDSSYFNEYPRSASLSERYRWFFKQCETRKKCSFCQTLPDDLIVNTGGEDRFPDAFYKLAIFENPRYESEFNQSDFRRCPECGTYFQWINLPEMYGAGNNDNERLIRLSDRVSRLLDKIFSATQEENSELNNIGEYFDHFPQDILLKALEMRVATAPKVVAPFVPELVRFLVKSDKNSPVSRLLRDYISNKPERVKEIVKALRCINSAEYSSLTALLLYCLTVVENKN